MRLQSHFQRFQVTLLVIWEQSLVLHALQVLFNFLRQLIIATNVRQVTCANKEAHLCQKSVLLALTDQSLKVTFARYAPEVRTPLNEATKIFWIAWNALQAASVNKKESKTSQKHHHALMA